MARLVRSLPVPWPVIVILVGLALVAWVQGLRSAAERSAQLQPRRVVTIVPSAAATDSVHADAAFVNVDLGRFPPPRVGLYQILPARPLVRWIEPADVDPARRWLVVPLGGLPPGTYAVCAVDPDADAGPVEMDRPLEELDELGRFRVVDRSR